MIIGSIIILCIFTILSNYISYRIGFYNGMKTIKKIDDTILDEYRKNQVIN